jgi:hypothetical protein
MRLNLDYLIQGSVGILLGLTVLVSALALLLG